MWLADNLKLEVANNSRELYGPRGVAHLGAGDDDDGEEYVKVTPSYQPRNEAAPLITCSLRHI